MKKPTIRLSDDDVERLASAFRQDLTPVIHRLVKEEVAGQLNNQARALVSGLAGEGLRLMVRDVIREHVHVEVKVNHGRPRRQEQQQT